jgi:hypothetical protein
MIVSVFVHGNGDHSNRSFRAGYGFESVTVQVLDVAGKVIFEQAVALAGTPDPDVQVHPNVAGRAVVLLFSGSEAPDCGGFSELEITALR